MWRYSRNFVVDLLRKWMNKSEYVPLGGIAYYVSAPSSSEDMAANPFHSLFFVVFMLSACALFSKYVAALPPSTSSPRRCCQEASLRVPPFWTIRSFLQECAEIEEYHPEGMPVWCTLLVLEIRSLIVPVYTIEEDVKPSLLTYSVFLLF
ncbi:uncharacterized protein LOC115714380 isoform X2 [Cannabis sativa]|uniref:uncharacterized protein LOC115714380 isoform X2 n=1 Tax=Cannabis sativa TaxID=3483 RepID=UPI0029CA15BC|nr:uncharacterized protein LOC115714380 isoform X2 [Cannabis sativa]